MLDLRDGSSFSRNPGAGIRKKWAGKTGREYLPALPVQCAKNPWLLYGLSGQVFRLKRPARGFTFPTLSGQWQLRRRAAFLKLRSALTATGSPGNFTPVPVFGRGVSPRTPGVPTGPIIPQSFSFVNRKPFFRQFFPAFTPCQTLWPLWRSGSRSPIQKRWEAKRKTPSTANFWFPSRWSSKWWNRANGTGKIP